MKRNSDSPSVGRSHEVTLRGYRIDCSEVAAALAGLAGIDRAVVIDRDDRPGDKRLVGYVTECDAGVMDPAGARAALAEQLPSYMVPAEVLVLETFPLKADGDLDIRALPAPEIPIQPRIRDALQEIFIRLLGVQRVG